MCRSGHEQPPYAVRRLIRHTCCLFVTRFQPANPVVQCQHVVLAQAFDVADFKSSILGNPRADSNRCRIGVRENEGQRKRSADIERWIMSVCDAMVQEHAPRTQKTPRLFEVIGQHPLADVLNHSNACQFVE